jgi:hypothetical protein
MSLTTGHKLLRHARTLLSMTDTAISRVEALNLHKAQPLDQPIDDAEYNHDYDLPAPGGPNVFDKADYVTVDHDEVADLLADAPHPVFDPLADAARKGAVFADDGHDADDSDDDNADDGNNDDGDDDDGTNNDGADNDGAENEGAPPDDGADTEEAPSANDSEDEGARPEDGAEGAEERLPRTTTVATVLTQERQ